MNTRTVVLAQALLVAALFAGPSFAADDEELKKDLTAVIALQGLPCGEVVAVTVEERLPVEPVRHHLPEPCALPLVGHLQEQQVGELLDVLDRADAVVAQHVAEVPELLDELVRVGHRASGLLRSSSSGSRYGRVGSSRT